MEATDFSRAWIQPNQTMLVPRASGVHLPDIWIRRSHPHKDDKLVRCEDDGIELALMGGLVAQPGWDTKGEPAP